MRCGFATLNSRERGIKNAMATANEDRDNPWRCHCLHNSARYGSAQELGDQRVYLLVSGQKALGILKVGKKRLFVACAANSKGSDVRDAFTEIDPLSRAQDFFRNSVSRVLDECI